MYQYKTFLRVGIFIYEFITNKLILKTNRTLKPIIFLKKICFKNCFFEN